MFFRLDTVNQHELDHGVGQGKIVRTGLITNIPLPFSIPDPEVLIRSLNTFGMPQRGDRYPSAAYSDYFVKRHTLRALNATQVQVLITYEWLGLFTVRDTSTLASVQTQIHPTGQPIYVQWKNPNDAGGPTIKKVATMHATLPLRHIIATATIDHVASKDILDGFGSVNKFPWNGLPTGFWLFSGLDGESLDEFRTYTYTTVFTTKMFEDWAQLEYIRDEHGNPIPIDPDDVEFLKHKPYEYSVDQSVNGLTKVGMYPLLDFYKYFGGSPS